MKNVNDHPLESYSQIDVKFRIKYNGHSVYKARTFVRGMTPPLVSVKGGKYE